jgi:HK97 gp10 family phage protein
MAITVNGMDEVLRKLEKLSNQSHVEGIAKKAVNAAKSQVVSSMKSALSASETGPHATGSVAASVSPTEAKVNSYGVYSVARPTGRDSKGERNGAKAAYLEYGTQRMAARPWRSQAVASAESACIKTMENIVKSEMQLD